jgi:iron-sulfur cluster assembly accessory protein
MSVTDSPAIQVSEKAAQQILSLLGADTPTKGLRVFVEPGGCSGLSYGMELNARQANDQEFEQFGIKLFVDEQAISYLKGSTIDYADGLTGAGFRITNPNAKHTCGCGKSFDA